ncbi:MAG: DUF1573 domain-containing protein [Bacteroidales bacterium]|nr:DUF1573 domain-containing protein [Bacteroidales bacterium]
MKRYLLVLFLSNVLLFASCKGSSEEKQIDVSVVDNMTEIKFEKKELDFKLVEAGEVVQGSFIFTNEGKYPLVIYDVSTSCGCTVADYPKGEIAPGEKGMISVRYDSEGSSGMRISKEVTVNANTTPAKTKLRIIADVR